MQQRHDVVGATVVGRGVGVQHVQLPPQVVPPPPERVVAIHPAQAWRGGEGYVALPSLKRFSE